MGGAPGQIILPNYLFANQKIKKIINFSRPAGRQKLLIFLFGKDSLVKLFALVRPAGRPAGHDFVKLFALL